MVQKQMRYTPTRVYRIRFWKLYFENLNLVQLDQVLVEL